MKRRALSECKTLDEVCQLDRDNFTQGDYWLMFDGAEVTVAHQESGQRAKAMVSMPRAAFNALIRRYQRPRRIVRK